MKILVVEDDRSIRETLGIVLESYQFEAFLAESGEAAIQSLEKDWPDVLLLDLTLEEMTGEELYERIHEKFGQVPPTVVLSAVQHGEQRVQHLEGVRFLAKPYTLEQLTEVLRRAASRSSAA